MTEGRWTSDRALIEWGLVGVVLAVLALTFLYHLQAVSDQVEVASVKTTVAALRTALALHHVGRGSTGGQADVASIEQGPFGLLHQRPVNFAGAVRHGRTAVLVQGAWVFDPDCACVGYTPLRTPWRFGSDPDATLWFQLIAGAAAPRLQPMGRYVMRGQPIE